MKYTNYYNIFIFTILVITAVGLLIGLEHYYSHKPLATSQTALTIATESFEAIKPICNSIEGQDVTVTDFGADGSDTIADSKNIRDAVMCLIYKSRLHNNLSGTLYFPAGKYIFDSEVKFDNLIWFDTSGISIKGAGPMQTILVAKNKDGIFNFEINRVGITVTLEDFRMVPGQSNVATAVYAKGLDQGSTHHSTFTMRHIDIGGENGSSIGLIDHNFIDGVKLNGIHRPVMDTVYITGAFGPLANINAQQRLKSCFNFEDTYTPQILQSRCWSAEYGVKYFSNKPFGDAGPEGGLISQSKFVEVNTGVYVKSNSFEPALVVTESHINARKIGILISGRKFVQIINNLFYQGDAQRRNYTDILLKGVEKSTIIGNIFHAPFQPEILTKGRHMIELSNLSVERNRFSTYTKKSNQFVIANNIFAPIGDPVVAAEDVNIYATGNIGYKDSTQNTDTEKKVEPQEVPPNYVTVVYPNEKNTVLYKGDLLHIKWHDTISGTYPYYINVRGSTLTNNSMQITKTAKGTTFDWKIPQSFQSGKYTIQICRRGYQDVPEGRCDQSDALFLVQ